MENSDSKSDHAAPQAPQQISKIASHERVTSDPMERPSSGQYEHERPNQHSDAETYNDSDSEDTDPAHEIESFDWEDLHQRYHDAIKQSSAQENDLMEEWSSLMNVPFFLPEWHDTQLTIPQYFRIWAESGHEHETDRTFRRHVA